MKTKTKRVGEFEMSLPDIKDALISHINKVSGEVLCDDPEIRFVIVEDDSGISELLQIDVIGTLTVR